MADDMHREDVKALIRKSGITLTQLAEKHDYDISSFSRAMVYPMPNIEAIIADAIGMRPQDVWPSRYTQDGHPKNARSARSIERTLRADRLRRTAKTAV